MNWASRLKAKHLPLNKTQKRLHFRPWRASLEERLSIYSQILGSYQLEIILNNTLNMYCLHICFVYLSNCLWSSEIERYGYDSQNTAPSKPHTLHFNLISHCSNFKFIKSEHRVKKCHCPITYRPNFIETGCIKPSLVLLPWWICNITNALVSLQKFN